MKLILTHENADFDAIASMLGASKLYPDAIPILPTKISRAVQEFLLLYKNALPFVHQKDWKRGKQQVEEIILTDTQTYQSIKGVSETTATLIIDHHPLERDLENHEKWDGEIIGSASTLVVERIRKRELQLDSLEATLLALGIYADTGMLTYSGTTPRDVTAVAWLLNQGAVLNTIRRFLTLPLTDVQQEVFDKLLRGANHQEIQGHSVTVAVTSYEMYVEGIATVTHRLLDVWDSSAIFTVVEMGDKIQLVCRSRVDDIDVSLVAEHFGGGGHPKAAAASISEHAVGTVIEQIWQYLEANIRPAVRVEDLMSNGLQYLNADDLLIDKLSIIRRVGHEGYPVVDDNRIVGLLTRRDADRASEHQLKSLKIRDVMIEGTITIKPEDSVSNLEQLMVDSGWGQIPVVDDDEKPIGIVTRTDLIKHWAKTHPNQHIDPPSITFNDIADILGDPVAQLITLIAKQVQDIAVYMVGGVVRDLILKRKNLDIDFVVEGDAIAFTKNLVEQYGGTIHSHKMFGTAKWILDDTLSTDLELPPESIPHHIDFATSRFEYYEQPTALPTVYSSGIKLDLQRRDFTINTLAIQMSQQSQQWRILDYYGGLDDLDEGLIRVLHSLSFIDDPTRILRAVRFSERLRFVIEPRTSQLIRSALPMLKRITGERLQNEITLLLNEDSPERGILKLQALGILEAIHPEFRVSIHLSDYFERCRYIQLPWDAKEQDITRLYWHLMIIGISASDVDEICSRLGFGRPLTESMIATSSLVENYHKFSDVQLKPSQIVHSLEKMPEIAIQVAWIVLDDHDQARLNIKDFMSKWRHQRAIINGNDLKHFGIQPGPQYKIILEKLRFGWIDGEIKNEREELSLLQQLIEQENLNDDNT